ncbi:flavodoxin I [Balneicella halophila]|uniref:Flavodoxin n=1 Tax=Balneicella halophila TaxID=1537566 RepID=A0A7L4UST6_BALHA|nr:flavodoxin [Balneicella halophila]PVX52602.1 flavodoxin I [Balneicella halophila]
MDTVILYGSSGGNTADVAEKIKDAYGEGVTAIDVADASEENLNGEFIILGISTWGIGDLQDDFEDFLDTLKEADLSDKTIALFGLGDQDGYPDTFCDGMGLVYEAVKDNCKKVVGFTSTDGYEFDESISEVDGQFVGLVIDEDNQSELTDGRIEKWVKQIKEEVA